MEKLRRDFLKERKAMEEAMKTVVSERKKPTIRPPPPPPPIHKKMIVDPQKLENSIKKACVPVVKNHIKILDKPPPPPPPRGTTSTPVIVAVCKAMNLNGTPCKCRAKVGKFCAKHAP
jgi:hypothetical protein